MFDSIRQMWRHLLARLRSGGFLANVLVLAGGTGLSQLILILSSPILTRLYPPAEFGVLAVFSSSLGMLVVVATLRYEFALPLPTSSSMAMNLVVVNGVALLGTSALTGLVLWLFGPQILSWLSIPELGPFLWLLPVAMFIAGGAQSLSYWFVRQRQFDRITQSKVGQGFAIASSQLLMGWLGAGAAGLIVGNVLGRAVGALILFFGLLKTGGEYFRSISLERVKQAAWRYRRFPLISSWSGLLNQGGLQLPTLLFASFFGVEVAGWYGLAQRMAGVPITLVAYSVSQVYFGEASRLRNEDPTAMRSLFLRVASRLLLFVGAPMLLLGLTAPWVFGFVFGEQWRLSGWYIVLLLPMFLGQIVVRPLSQSLNILERQDIQLYWDIARLLTIVLVIIASRFLFGFGMMMTLGLYSFAMLGMYGIYFVVMFRQISQPLERGEA